MRFQRAFTRQVGSGPFAVLGSDAIPADRTFLGAGRDNSLQTQPLGSSGLPVRRIAVAIAAPPACPRIPVTVYFWDDATEAWYAGSIPIQLRPGKIGYFAVPTVQSTVGGSPGAIEAIIVADAPAGAPVGLYAFAVAGVVAAL